MPEDLANVAAILHEGNRLNGNQRVSNIYLKRVVYGNKFPYDPAGSGGTADAYRPVLSDASAYFFSLVLDYGDHDPVKPNVAPSTTWACRWDAFSNYKPGFDWRCYRLCRRFLLFHDFPELGAGPVVVRSLDLTYRGLTDYAEADFPVSMTITGWSGSSDTGYETTSYPSLTFTYQLPVWDSAVQTVPLKNIPNMPEGLSHRYQFTDLWNEGIAGILSEQGGGWYYSSNCGEGVFAPVQEVSPRPSMNGLTNGTLQLQSLTGDGRKFIVSNARPDVGYFPLTDSGEWLPFEAFERYPALDLNNPNIKMIDLDGDGMAEIVLSEEDIFVWYPALGTAGYDSPELAIRAFDEEKGPAVVFADPVESIYLADMTGDGLTDIVRIRNGEISYWPNMGYGRFGAKVNMSHAPVFDDLSGFNPGYLRLSDINGTGATDIIYLGRDRFRAWLNLGGNAWGQPFELGAFPDTTVTNPVTVTDLLGNGTACIVWSSPLPNNADAPLRYIDLMGGRKPYLLHRYSNGMGKQVELTFRSSTWFYLQDKLAGTPWITKLFFPVFCVSGTKVSDAVSGSEYSCSYAYHHGYYDHAEKEFRGFGRVEQTDTDIFDTNATADQAPVLTKTWYHTGAWFGANRMLDLFEQEYFQNTAFSEYELPRPVLPSELTADEAREAARACKGMVLRQEVYALDADKNPGLAGYPYSVAEHNNTIRVLQPSGDNLYASFLVLESEAITYHYERNPADPRVGHTLNTAYDGYGNLLESYAVSYPRGPVDVAHPGGMELPGGQVLPDVVLQEQQKTYITYTKNAYTQALVVDGGVYRLPVGCEAIAYQAEGVSPASGDYFSIADLAGAAGIVLTRLKQQRSIFLADDLVTPLPFRTLGSLGLVYQQYHLAFDATVTALSGKVTDAMLSGGHYEELDEPGEWWVPSGRVDYLKSGVALPFFLGTGYEDAYGFVTTVEYDGYFLLMRSVTDAVGNVTQVSVFDYRVMAAGTIVDPNNNATDIRYDRLGLLTATALRGKGEGDVLDADFTADLPDAVVAEFFSDAITNGPGVLQGATTRNLYRFPGSGDEPFAAGAVTRRLYSNQVLDARVDKVSVPYQYSFEYTDGLGRSAMKKLQSDLADRPWIGTGKVVYNNKGKPVMQYEPFFSVTPGYEEAPANGVTPVLHYDPLGRVVRTDLPDGSFSKTAFDGWVEIGYDPNDTVRDSWWYAQAVGSADPLQVDAAAKAAAHDGTPGAKHLDGLGRPFYAVAYNRANGVEAWYAERSVLDLQGNILAAIDPMGNIVMQFDYDLLKRMLHQVSMDSGERWMVHDCMDKPLYQWDVNGADAFVYRYEYDRLHRPVKSFLQTGGNEYLFAYNIYGEGVSGDVANNLRTRAYRQWDDAGVQTGYRYDLNGNPLSTSRALTTRYKAAQVLLPVNVWSGDIAADMSMLEQDGGRVREYAMEMTYDALNRMVLQVVNGMDTMVQGYGAAGMLNTVDMYYGGGSVPTPVVTGIQHNEKGQRLSIIYGNRTVTRYRYDPLTFRLVELTTTRNGGADVLQDISYYYDPAGNITYATDGAQPPVFYNNQEVIADGNYTYDAIYRLIRGSGREQIAQNTVNENAGGGEYRDFPFGVLSPLPAPTDSLAMRNYTQVYSYDAVGNMLQLQHVAGSGSYTRAFVYDKNQLMSTKIGNGNAVAYGYDGHGNLLGLPQLSMMGWNFKDQLAGVNSGQSTWYNYDVSGTRVRKVTERVPGTRVAERLYLGTLEIYRTYDGAGNAVLQRDTLHIMDDKHRVAMTDIKRMDTGSSDKTVTGTAYLRFQYGNLLDSVAFELDANAKTISYEEYHPFGTSSYQAADAGLDVPVKRYRYTGKERDEESGLYYHGARYYAPWLCRWVSCDPIGIKDGLNVYVYVKGNPVKGSDPTGTAIHIKDDGERIGKDEEAMALEMIQHDVKKLFGLDLIYNEKDRTLTVGDTNKDGRIDMNDIKAAREQIMSKLDHVIGGSRDDRRNAKEVVDIFLKSMLPDKAVGHRSMEVTLSGWNLDALGQADKRFNQDHLKVTLFVRDFFREYQLGTVHPPGKDDPERMVFGPVMVLLHEMVHNRWHTDDTKQKTLLKDPRGATVRAVNVIEKALGLPIRENYISYKKGGYFIWSTKFDNGELIRGQTMSLNHFKLLWDTGINLERVGSYVSQGVEVSAEERYRYDQEQYLNRGYPIGNILHTQ